MRPEPDDDRATDGRPTDRTPSASDDAARNPDTLRLWEEQVSFDRERVETGRVRVRVVTHEHEETVEVPLMTERVEVERIPIGREVDAMPERRQEGDTTIVPVVEEVVVLQRKLILREELRFRLVRITEQHRENVVLRRQEAVIERLPAQGLSAPPRSE
jgi:uncharacterized protein (TIGR02271 family)